MLAVTAFLLAIFGASCKLSTQTRRTRGGVVGQKSLPLNSSTFSYAKPVASAQVFSHVELRDSVAQPDRATVS